MCKDKFLGILSKIDVILTNVSTYIQGNKKLILLLALITVATYGFELFNFNLTIDEEVASTTASPNIAWISQGRWGMYLLNKFLFPFSTMPFVPLFVALVFQMIAVLLIINCMAIESKVYQVIVGSLFITYPGIAYIYTFSTINFGIGIGLFLVAFSLFIYENTKNLKKFLAVIPAALAISIYQGFIPAMFSIYLLYIISAWGQKTKNSKNLLTEIFLINLLAILIYFATQQMISAVVKVPNDSYVEQYFDIAFLYENATFVLKSLSSLLFKVYSGSKETYGLSVPILSILMILLSFGVVSDIFCNKMRFGQKVVRLIFSFVFLFIPFLSGLLTRGSLSMRFLVGLPIVISGWAILGMKSNARLYKMIVVLLSFYCVFQFIQSSNFLFASSNLALQNDRMLGSQLINRIEDAKVRSDSSDIKYIEVVGYYDRPETLLIPKIETFGSSFFEWDQGNVWRMIIFLQTLGYEGLYPPPIELRGQMVDIADAMPNWPNPESVKVIDDYVIVKFGPYSYPQRISICQLPENRADLQPQGFCP